MLAGWVSARESFATVGDLGFLKAGIGGPGALQTQREQQWLAWVDLPWLNFLGPAEYSP